MKKILRSLIAIVTVVVLCIAIYYSRDYILRTIYPLKYTDIVNKYSQEYDVECAVLYAIIKSESDFKPDAVSSIGAVGLMQITEETFDWIKYKLEDTESVYDDMYDPDKNIKYGAYLISFHINRFGSLENALCAYHAGMGALDSWLANEKYSNDGKTLLKIPYKDTAHYVKTVQKAYDKYKDLYDLQ